MMTTRERRLTAAAVTVALSTWHAAASTQAQETAPTSITVMAPGTSALAPFLGVDFIGNLYRATGAIGVAGGYTWSPEVPLEGESTVLPSSKRAASSHSTAVYGA